MHGRLQVGAERGKIQFFCVWSVSSRKWLELTAQGLYVVQQGSLRVYWCYWGGGIALVTYPGSQRCNIVPATALRVLYHSIYIVPAAAGTKAVSCSQTFCKH